MTAADVRELAARVAGTDDKKVRLVLDLWYEAIKEAVKGRREFVRESDLPKLRTPIPPSAYQAARTRLQMDGFTVFGMQEGPNESTYEVRW